MHFVTVTVYKWLKDIIEIKTLRECFSDLPESANHRPSSICNVYVGATWISSGAGLHFSYTRSQGNTLDS